MRIAVISAPARRMPPPDYVQALAKGMTMMGHQVEILDAWTDNGTRLPAFEYIAIVQEPLSLFSAKVPDIIPKMLSASSGLSSKRGAGFVRKGGLRSGKTLINLMNAMEKEGILVNWGEILLGTDHAEAMGKRIGA